MNTLQIGLGSLTSAYSNSHALSLKTQDPSNSFGDRLSEAFAHSIQRNGATQAVAAPRLSHAATARQGFAAVRRDLVTNDLSGAVMATLTNSPASTTTPASTPATTTTPTTAITTTMATSSTTAAGGTSGSTSTVVDGLTPFLGYNAAPSDTSGSTETPAEIVAGLLSANAPPQPYASIGQASTDPSVFMSGSYQRDLNLNWYLQVANHDNAYRYQTYSDAVQTWANNGMQGDPPAAPKYEAVDVSGFDSWWQQYCANPGQDAPPVNFLANGPAVQG